MRIEQLADWLGRDATHWPPIEEAPVAGARSWRELTFANLYGYRPLAMDVHVPEGEAPAGGWPCVVWIHGGSWRGGDRRYVPLEWPQQALFEKLVAAGMAVATIDYRRVDAKPMPACINDCFAAVRYLRAYAETLTIDPDRIGVWGESAGAHLAAMLALVGSESDPAPELLGREGVAEGRVDVACCCFWYGVADLRSIIEYAAAQTGYSDVDLVGQYVEGGLEMADLCSPLHHLHAGAPPFLVMVGDADDLAPQSHALHQALTAAGLDSELEVVPGADHVFAGRDVVPYLDRAVAWLKERLGA